MTREMNTLSGQSAQAANNIGTNLSKALGNQPLVKAANNAMNSATNAATAVANVAVNAMNGAANVATNAMNSIIPTAPLNSSLTRLGNNINRLNNSVQNGFNSVGDEIRNNVNKAVNNTANALNLGNGNSRNSNYNLMFGNNGRNAAAGAPTNIGEGVVAEGFSGVGVLLGIFLALVLVLVLLFYYFATEIKDGYEKLFNAIRSSLGLETTPPPPPKETVPDALVPPPSEPVVPTEQPQNLLEKVLPLGRNPEVFNVSKNDFTYYDAEPLCRALGAELATYDQLKEAYDKGADWCNYGWVKGQVAVYPTQKATWDQLQKGPEDQQEACGRPGVNGGFFDNPEMRFGVNCYGPKPSQSAHDEAELMKQGRIPRTTSSLKVEEKINEYKQMADSLGVMPFSKEKWGSL
jgi:hypothetical protein